MKKEYLYLVVVAVLLAISCYIAFLIPFILFILATALPLAFIDNKVFATIASFVLITMIGSVFSIIIYYFEPTKTILQFESAMTILTWLTVTKYIDLLINLWIDSQGIWLHWVVVSIAIISIIGIFTINFFNDSN